MLKVHDWSIVFREVPNEITLAFDISNCPHHCKGCHSPELWEDVGKPLTPEFIRGIVLTIQEVPVTCIAFMGGDADYEEVFKLNKEVKKMYHDIKTCWYTGFEYYELNSRMISHRINEFDYIKIGPYKEECGALDNPNTNQVMFKKTSTGSMVNITKEFQKMGQSKL